MRTCTNRFAAYTHTHKNQKQHVKTVACVRIELMQKFIAFIYFTDIKKCELKTLLSFCQMLLLLLLFLLHLTFFNSFLWWWNIRLDWPFKWHTFSKNLIQIEMKRKIKNSRKRSMLFFIARCQRTNEPSSIVL